MPWMDVICSEVRFMEISSPSKCDKILKIPNEQTEPTDYMANCSKDNYKTFGSKVRGPYIYILKNDHCVFGIDQTYPIMKQILCQA